MDLPKFKHTYSVLIVDTVKELEVQVNQKLEEEYLLAGEFRIHEGKFYQPMMHSVFVGEPIKPETRMDNFDEISPTPKVGEKKMETSNVVNASARSIPDAN